MCLTMKWEHNKGSSICTSTAYEGFETPYVFDNEVRAILDLDGSTASTKAHYTVVCPLGGTQHHVRSEKTSRIVIRTHQYAHLQHMKVVKHLICV